MTQQLYLENSYQKTMTATILEVQNESPNKWKLVLDQTIFYPKGGGQPTDQGVLRAKLWQGNVSQVIFQDGKIIHYVETSQTPMVGEEVEGEIDWERRYLNMRLHSAGHIIDFALHLLQYKLIPLKADHGKKATIWYQGILEPSVREILEAKANALVSQNLQFSSQFVMLEELSKKALYLQLNLPTNKPLRMLTLETVGSVADGGTMVQRTKEVGPIQILPIEIKEGVTLIRYVIDYA